MGQYLVCWLIRRLYKVNARPRPCFLQVHSRVVAQPTRSQEEGPEKVDVACYTSVSLQSYRETHTLIPAKQHSTSPGLDMLVDVPSTTRLEQFVQSLDVFLLIGYAAQA